MWGGGMLRESLGGVSAKAPPPSSRADHHPHETLIFLKMQPVGIPTKSSNIQKEDHGT